MSCLQTDPTSNPLWVETDHSCLLAVSSDRGKPETQFGNFWVSSAVETNQFVCFHI
jgi:hypothetical protein